MLAAEQLDVKQKGIIPIAAFTAKGDINGLKSALNEGLDTGLTINEINEVLVQLYAYCGFPRSLNGISAFMEVLEDRAAKGIKDEPGKEPSPFPADKSKLAFGTENQTKLTGQVVSGPVYDFSPAIDAFLKEHLFGDIFGRDNLDWQSRELATVSALAAIDGVDSQLRAHLGISLYTGLTEAQMQDFVAVLRAKVGQKEADNAATNLKAVLDAR